MNNYLKQTALLVGLVISVNSKANDLALETYKIYVSKAGEISLPENFRTQLTHLGSWVVVDTKAPGHGFHDVYAQPEAVLTFQKTGKFPDGAILVKEIRKINSGKLTTGEVAWAGDNAVWFVMIKDSVGRFKGNPNWGEGWGWALFEAKTPKANASKGYLESCLGCHTPAKQSDWIFVQGYPTLRAK
jgi:Cytochrome P460